MTSEKTRLRLDDATRALRLDQALARLLPDHSRSSLARLVEEGQVTVDGGVVTKPSHRLDGASEVAIQFPPARPTQTVSQDLPLDIIYQDDDLAVLNKPAGMVVHPAAGHVDSTVVNALLFHLKNLSGIGGELRPGIVHRLDKDTSGLLLVAKNDEAHRRLTEIWASDTRKEYLALVYGTPKQQRGSIEKPIGRDPRDRKRMAVVPGGRKAHTDYEVLEQHRYVALLRCVLKTGRTHQIRVHLKSIGHPIVGDPAYSGPQWRGIPDKRLQKVMAASKRQALHAWRMSFPHPRTGAPMSFEAPIPRDMAELLDVIRVSSRA